MKWSSVFDSRINVLDPFGATTIFEKIGIFCFFLLNLCRIIAIFAGLWCALSLWRILVTLCMIDRFFFEEKKVAFFTLGCKLNFAETSYLGNALLERGMRVAGEGEQADLCLVNTCSVTELADKKSRQLIRRLHREHPHARIVVTGCYAQLKPDEVAGIDGVDLVLGAKEKGELIEYLDRMESRGGSAVVLNSAIEDATSFAPSVSSEGRTRHFLKVQDGCDYRCSYCTIPKARGRSRNGSIHSMVTMAEQVAREGGREIVLTGVNVGDFGRSTGERFIDLIRALDEVEGIDRFRISSIEPNLITEEVIRFVAQSRRFAPHFHIPLQSGSDHVLRLMRRRYKREIFAQKVRFIRDLMPHAYIGVDVIVGARGERDEDFEDSYDFIQHLPVSKLHVFSYSERAGTDALDIDHVVSARDKHRRSQRLIALSDLKLRDFNISQIGSSHAALIEHTDSTQWLYGYTGNYVRVCLPYEPTLMGQLVPIRLLRLSDDEPEVVIAERML